MLGKIKNNICWKLFILLNACRCRNIGLCFHSCDKMHILEAYWVFIITEILKEDLGLNIPFGQLVFTCRINNMFRILFKKKNYLYSCLNSVEKMVLFRVSSCKICGKNICFNLLERYFDFEYVFYQQNINHYYFFFHFCHLIQWNMGIMNLALHVEILLCDINRSNCS